MFYYLELCLNRHLEWILGHQYPMPSNAMQAISKFYSSELIEASNFSEWFVLCTEYMIYGTLAIE